VKQDNSMAIQHPSLSSGHGRGSVRPFTRGYWFAAVVALIATVMLVVWSPRPSHGADAASAEASTGVATLVSLSQPGSRALRTIDPMPHESVPESAEPDVWCVSTRRLPDTCRVPLSPNLGIEQFVGQGTERSCGRGRWERSDLTRLLGNDGSEGRKPLVIFIHGNRYDPASAKQQGLLMARHCAAACPGTGGVRTVVFSWPSEQQGLLLKDGRAKYERAFSEGRYMAWLLGQIDPLRPVAIVGYSYGALITLEGLKNLITAEQAGRTDLQPWLDRPAPTNLVFIAAAVRCDAFAPRGPYRHTLDCVDRVSLITNSSDDALRFFHLLDRNTNVDALGYVGMPRRWLPDHVEFSAVDGGNIIGRNHGLPLYLSSPSLTKRLCTAAACGLNAE
jgi:pimeloyl-ACP methyl ester carboxylesterase